MNNNESSNVDKKITKIVDDIKKLTTLEVVELVKLIETTFNVSASAMVSTQEKAESSDGGSPDEEVKISLILKGVGGNKVSIIKLVKEINNLDLMKAKKFTESIPAVIKENISKDEADELSKRFTDAGADVEIKTS